MIKQKIDHEILAQAKLICEEYRPVVVKDAPLPPGMTLLEYQEVGLFITVIGKVDHSRLGALVYAQLVIQQYEQDHLEWLEQQEIAAANLAVMKTVGAMQ